MQTILLCAGAFIAGSVLTALVLLLWAHLTVEADKMKNRPWEKI